MIMMFSGFGLKNGAIRSLALVLLSLVIVSAVFELRGIAFFHINTGGMLQFDHFALLFTLIATVSTLVFFLLSARDMEAVG